VIAELVVIVIVAVKLALWAVPTALVWIRAGCSGSGAGAPTVALCSRPSIARRAGVGQAAVA
jgi:hypothetical protein